MEVVRTVAALRERVDGWRAAGARVALVPTMGALHAAHDALVAAARGLAGRTAATIFVNPRQFADGEDLASYPRDEAADLRRLEAAGADLAFAPAAEEMYPEGFATSVVPAGPAEGLCGAERPGHFTGVATVVLKLLLQARPDAALFGEKDYQQLVVVRRMARDLDLPVEIAAVPTVREPDGLACSSRNAYLDPAQRRAAPALHRALAGAAAAVEAGAAPRKAAAAARRAVLGAGFDRVDYVELRDAGTLAPVPARAGRPARLLGAARLGRTRLIDNVPLAY